MLLGWRHGILLFFGILLTLVLIAGVVLNTTFLVREIRRNAQHDAFINAVTHELKTPVASIRLYLETLQSRAVDETKRQEFYRPCWRTATGCWAPSSRFCAPDASATRSRHLNLSHVDFGARSRNALRAHAPVPSPR